MNEMSIGRTDSMRPHPIRIIVVQGHRNTSGGDPREVQRTPAIANAIEGALERAGHEVIGLQQEDGSPDNWFDGSLDAVARRVMWYHAQKPVDMMLDIHIEGDGANTPGIFAIVPDGDTLQTVTGYTGVDSWESNTRDRALAAAIVRRIAETTGLQIRTRSVIEPGVMSERQTYVGSDLGWRLAMFGYTAPARERMVRLVIECGNIVADGDRIFSEAFPAQVARGVVRGIMDIDGGVEPSIPTPIPGGGGFPAFGTTRDLRTSRVVTVVVPLLRARRFAETTQPILAEWPKGHRIAVSGWIIGESVEENPVWWLTGRGRTTDRRWRVWSGGTDPGGSAVLKLPVIDPREKGRAA